MAAKKIDELTLGATYWCVPRKGMQIRKAPRTSIAAKGELLVLDTYLVRRVKDGDVQAFDLEAVEPVVENVATEAPAPEAASETTAPAKEPASTPAKRRAQGE